MNSSVGGFFDRLLWNGLLPGTYELEENNVAVKLVPKDEEVVLLFQLDERKKSPPGRGCNELRLGKTNGPICDGLFFYRKELDANPWLLFFELKGKQDLPKAVSQLESGMEHLAQNLHSRWLKRWILCVVATTSESPSGNKELIKRFTDKARIFKLNARIEFVPCAPGKAVDLREVLEKQISRFANR